MKARSIMYHDIVESEQWESSGFVGSGADVYKLDSQVFSRHLDILQANKLKPCLVWDVNENREAENVLITFDDGGKSAYTHAANLLEKKGWRGHFFVTTNFIDTAPFLQKDQIRELHQRGHLIGSHSASHPIRMANCTKEEMLFEWRESIKKLSDILEEPVTVASVPGGYFSKQVAQTASECGIKFLFNSEPVTKVYQIDNCKIFGRYTIQQETSLTEFDQLAKGMDFYKFRQYALWNVKKVAKKLGGQYYLDIRKKKFDG